VVKDDHAPLTRHELARLLRAFAHMLEVSEDPPAPERRAPRRHDRGDPTKVSDLSKARMERALRRRGILP
jgi:hypothetical protein